jgi:hypothetical protein
MQPRPSGGWRERHRLPHARLKERSSHFALLRKLQSALLQLLPHLNAQEHTTRTRTRTHTHTHTHTHIALHNPRALSGETLTPSHALRFTLQIFENG